MTEEDGMPEGESGMCTGETVSRAAMMGAGAAAGIGVTPALEQVQNFAEDHFVPVFKPG